MCDGLITGRARLAAKADGSASAWGVSMQDEHHQLEGGQPDSAGAFQIRLDQAMRELMLNRVVVERNRTAPLGQGMSKSRLLIAKKYREIAAGCEQKAATMADQIVRNHLLSLAGNWRKLADKAEHESG